MRVITKISKAVWIGLILILLSSCTTQTSISSASIEHGQNATGTAIVGSDSIPSDIPKEIIYPNLSDFKLEKMLDMSGEEILELLDENGFVFADNRWECKSIKGLFFILWFNGPKNPEESLKADVPFTDAIIWWEFPDIADGDMQKWWNTWPDITDFMVRECGLTDELGRGYVYRSSYRAYGRSNFHGKGGYLSAGCFLDEAGNCIVSANISQYSTSGFFGIPNEEYLVKLVKGLYNTPSDAIVEELPYERDARFTINDGGKSEEKQVLSIVIKDRELSESEAKSLVDEWIKGLFLNPDDYGYTYE